MKYEDLEKTIREYLRENPDGQNEVQAILKRLNGPNGHNPVSAVIWVSVDKVQANDYNPNTVAKTELKLLAVSILHDGFTQPVVTVYDKDKGKYVIVDGFHRYFCMKSNKEIFELNHGMLPIVVLDKDIKDRMASTVRHNRARGRHSVGGMGTLVNELSVKGWDDAAICNELGLEPDELLRMKHTSGVAALYADKEFSRSYEESYQIKARKEGAK